MYLPIHNRYPFRPRVFHGPPPPLPPPSTLVPVRACDMDRNRVNLTVEEVITAVEAQGATDVRKIDLRGKGAGMGDFMVFSTATNPMHMRRMANMVVQAVRDRPTHREGEGGGGEERAGAMISDKTLFNNTTTFRGYLTEVPYFVLSDNT